MLDNGQLLIMAQLDSKESSAKFVPAVVTETGEEGLFLVCRLSSDSAVMLPRNRRVDSPRGDRKHGSSR